MRKRVPGFTLIEVMITLVIMALVMESVTSFFLGWMRQYKQQSKIAESGVQTLVGLELLRRDVEHAGYGLPWNNLTGYQEATSGILNDAPNDPPRAIVSLNDSASSLNSSDYMVIKSAPVGTSAVAKRWTTLMPGGVVRSWSDGTENFAATDRIIVLSPGNSEINWRTLQGSTTFALRAGFAGGDTDDPRLIYGIDGPGGALRMPFNRADYYVTGAGVPKLCAPGTGMLVKSVVSVDNGVLSAPIPLLECVAGMHVVYRRDTTGDGAIDDTTNDISGLSAQEIRDQLKEIRVYILAHEGQADKSYTHAAGTIYVGEPGVGAGRNFVLDPTTTPSQLNFRWKVHALVVKPSNLR